METFWDTSAVVALLLKEPHSDAALKEWSISTRVWSWRWLLIETDSALSRRKAPPAAWSQWAKIQEHLNILDLKSSQWDSLRAFNRALRLRAADAAHLFVFERASVVVPGLQLVSFDDAMNLAARSIGLSVITQH